MNKLLTMQMRFALMGSFVLALLLAIGGPVAADGARRHGSARTGPVVSFDVMPSRVRADPGPTHRPAGCPAGHTCVVCVAGCVPPGPRIVSSAASKGSVSSWRRLTRRHAGDSAAIIRCNAWSCFGNGDGPLSRSVDVNVTVHKYYHY